MIVKWDAKNLNPDFSRIERMLLRQNVNDSPPLFELFINIRDEMTTACGPAGGRLGESLCGDIDENLRSQLNRIWISYRLGYDFARCLPINFNFRAGQRARGQSEAGSEHAFVQAGAHAIAGRTDFEQYNWPDAQQADYSIFEIGDKVLPEGMKIIGNGTGGILENVMWILGFEGLSYLIYDDETLVADLFEAVARRIIETFDIMASFDCVGAMALGDDIGFKTQPMISPAMLRKYLFPWHRRLVETVHRHGKPVILHSCGNRSSIIEDIIDCGWDGLHSYEDGIQPVWDAKRQFGDRLAVLGGFDMDKLCRFSPDQVRQYTRWLVEQCAPNGGWGIGSGNSIALYVPLENFFAMIDEGRNCCASSIV